MTDRVLVAEFPELAVTGDDTAKRGWVFADKRESNYRRLATGRQWVSQTKIDLSGYVLDDLTVYFRNSFEQAAAPYFGSWEVPDASVSVMNTYKTILQEHVILSSVPLSDANISALAFSTPGFIASSFTLPVFDPGTFDRTQIIHGHNKTMSVNDTTASEPLNADGNGYYTVFNYNDYSSLEPTAADCIYCYRILFLPASKRDGTSIAGMDDIVIPATRVMLNSMTSQEPELEYLMRLKRSYELANQV